MSITVNSSDVDKLLEPVSAAQPAGVDLEYDPDFAEMERAAVGEPERQVGDSIKEAIPPNWQMVERLAKNLATQTKDLRVAAYLVRAALANHGFPGFHAGVSLMRGYVENYWDTLHPLLDPDDDNDPTARINAIKSLVDPSTSLFLVRTATIIRSRSTGSFSLRDFWIAKGDQPPPANLTTVPTMAMIEGAVQDCSLDELQATATAVDQAIVAVKEIERIATAKVDSGNGPELSALVKDLQAIAKILTNWLGQRGVDAAQATTEVATADAGPTVVQSVTVAAVAPATAVGIPGQITNRREAIECLDRICQWFETYEPSSPLPLLLKRAKRLSSKSFLEILRDITPEGLTQAKALGGVMSEDLEALSPAPAPTPAPERKSVAAKPAARPRDDEY